MKTRRATKLVIVFMTTALICSCATMKAASHNFQHVVKGQAVSKKDLNQAVAQDQKVIMRKMAENEKLIEAELRVLHQKFEKVLAKLKTNVQKRWGRKETKVATRTVYVKYSHGYTSRVMTDFDHGVLTVETLDEKDPQGSLKTAIVSALLTSSDPASVDLFTDKDVKLDRSSKPYLYGLVLDNAGKPIANREQAEKYAEFLVPKKVQTHTVQGEEGGKTARFVKLSMVRNFEAKGAERYRASVSKYSSQYQVSPSLVYAIIRTESNFNPFAVSGAPAYGLMQLVPSSGGRAAFRRVKGVDQAPTTEYLFDPDHNIELGTAYLSVLSKDEFPVVSNQNSRDYCVIAAYNTGPGNVTKVFAKVRKEALRLIDELQPAVLFERLRTSLPWEETRQYVVKVTKCRKQFVDGAAAPPP
jgi:membrane-bound lytic murein transglycosylase C